MKIVFLAHNCNIIFIKNELLEIAKNECVKEVVLFTQNQIQDGSLDGIPKIKVIYYPDGKGSRSKFNIYHLWLKEVIFQPHMYNSLSKIRESLSYLRNESKKADYILNQSGSDRAVYYSYWADSEALILSLLKREGLRNLMVTRMHGYDVYEELDGKKGLPWRWLLLRYIDRFINISRHGLNYFTQRYPQVKFKTDCFYLGIDQSEDLSLNQAPESGYSIASCGWVNPHKKIIGIFRALVEMPQSRWEHFGDGDDYAMLKNLAAGQSVISVDLPGKLATAAIFDRYKGRNYTCFVSLSTTEGLPVSMMEAMAFGIPVVSTDVGGCSEIVNENTGVLLPENYTDEDVRNAVKLCAEKFSSPEARKRIQDECRRKFDAKTNYGRFVDFMIEENRKHWEQMK